MSVCVCITECMCVLFCMSVGFGLLAVLVYLWVVPHIFCYFIAFN